jgi:hypothetical protein
MLTKRSLRSIVEEVFALNVTQNQHLGRAEPVSSVLPAAEAAKLKWTLSTCHQEFHNVRLALQHL